MDSDGVTGERLVHKQIPKASRSGVHYIIRTIRRIAEGSTCSTLPRVHLATVRVGWIGGYGTWHGRNAKRVWLGCSALLLRLSDWIT